MGTECVAKAMLLVQKRPVDMHDTSTKEKRFTWMHPLASIAIQHFAAIILPTAQSEGYDDLVHSNRRSASCSNSHDQLSRCGWCAEHVLASHGLQQTSGETSVRLLNCTRSIRNLFSAKAVRNNFSAKAARS